MLHIGICDDNVSHLDHLEKLVRDYLTQENIAFDLTRASNGNEFLSSPIKFDIVFMDVDFEDEDMNGIEISTKLREQNKLAKIIYVTSYPEYERSAMETHFFFFLTKPLTKDVLEKKLAKAINYLKDEIKEANRYIKLITENGAKDFRVQDILYFESKLFNVKVYTLNGVYKIKNKLPGITAMLESYHFSVCQRGCLVNLDNVINVGDEVEFNNGTSIPISARRKSEFKKIFFNYIEDATNKIINENEKL